MMGPVCPGPQGLGSQTFRGAKVWLIGNNSIRSCGLLGLGLMACGAPESRQAEGPVADDVRTALESGTETFQHAEWDSLLARGTRDGLVDYEAFETQRSSLDAYLGRIANAPLDRLAPSQLKALLINAYNAYTIQSILDHPGVSSIRDIPGVWTERTHSVGGHLLTLDQIEHNLLRPFFRDPRIHFAVNCASLSCAPLPGWAFDGERLDEQLEERTTAFLSDPANVRLAGDALEVSKYFDWYGEDFVAKGWNPVAATIPDFIARYASPEVREAVLESSDRPSLRFLDYDWSLNTAPGL